MNENIENPAHYTAGSIECIDAIEAALTPEEYRGFIKGNVIKYNWRERHKGGNESLAKAAWYLNRLLAYGKEPPATKADHDRKAYGLRVAEAVRKACSQYAGPDSTFSHLSLPAIVDKLENAK
jgi:hypothetical protein